MMGVLIKGEIWTQTYIQKSPCNNEGRDWVMLLYTKECHRLPVNQQSPRRGLEKSAPPRPQEKPTIITHWSQTSGLQNWETKNYPCLNHSIRDTLLWPPLLSKTADFIYCLKFPQYANICCILRKTKYFHFKKILLVMSCMIWWSKKQCYSKYISNIYTCWWYFNLSEWYAENSDKIMLLLLLLLSRFSCVRLCATP